MVGSPKKRARREDQARRNNSLMVIPQPEEPRDRWGRVGRPTKFQPEYVDQARVLCEEGMTDKELAQFFEVDRSTIQKWRFDYPEFAAAVKLGKDQANDRMERTAYELAMGFSKTVTDIIKLKDNQGNEILREVDREVYIPPNPHVLMWMLKNRKPETWRDKIEAQVSGEIVHLTFEQAKERLAAKLLELRRGAEGDAS